MNAIVWFIPFADKDLEIKPTAPIPTFRCVRTDEGEESVEIKPTVVCENVPEPVVPTIERIGTAEPTDVDVANATIIKGKWAARVYDDWRDWCLTTKGKSVPSLDDFSKIPKEDIVTYMTQFLTEARKAKQSGAKYPPKTLYEIIYALQKHLSMNGCNVNFFHQEEFSAVRKTLEKVMKQGTAEGLTVPPKKAKMITYEQEDYLWANGFLGESAPDVLLTTIFWQTGIHFGLSTGDFRKGINLSNFTIGCDDNGRSYLQYHPKKETPKTHPPTITKVYESDRPQRCIVRLFKKYTSLCKMEALYVSLYLNPLKKPTEGQWYGTQPVGRNTLMMIVKRVMEAAGFGDSYTNQSLRLSNAGRMLYRPQGSYECTGSMKQS